jgi:hypothetical protein
MHLVVLALWLAAAGGQAKPASPPNPSNAIEHAFNRMYNCDFPGAHAILDEQLRKRPEDPLLYAVKAAAYLYSEFQRLEILETEFFANDDKVTDKKKVKPDPAVRAMLFRLTGDARLRATARLAVDAKDRDAMLAMCMATGVETDYTSLIEKKYIRGYSLSKESQQYARKLLSLNPPCYDAYLTLGSVEYVVGNLNFFWRLFVRFDQIEGSKQRAIEELKKVIDGGRYYPPFAKILLSVIYLREKQPQQALRLLKEMQRDFPENPLVKNEINRISGKISNGQLPTGTIR